MVPETGHPLQRMSFLIFIRRRCRRDRHHDGRMSASPYPPRIRRVPAVYPPRLFAGTELTVARIAATAWCSRTRNGARRGLEQCSGMLDLARSFPVGKEKPDTAVPTDLVAETGVQEGRQVRAFQDDRQVPNSVALAAIPSKLRSYP